jgi:hypothetical protein
MAAADSKAIRRGAIPLCTAAMEYGEDNIHRIDEDAAAI